MSIPIINAWKLLLKAKVIAENKNNLKSIYVMVPKIEKKGNKLKFSFATEQAFP